MRQTSHPAAAWQADQDDATAGEIDPMLEQDGLDAGLEARAGGLVRREEVGVAERVERMALAGEQAQATVQFTEFVQINGKEEDAVAEGVPPRGESGVHDLALVETGVHARRTSGTKVNRVCGRTQPVRTAVWRPRWEWWGRPAGAKKAAAG
jgi:hypothetical protein